MKRVSTQHDLMMGANAHLAGAIAGAPFHSWDVLPLVRGKLRSKKPPYVPPLIYACGPLRSLGGRERVVLGRDGGPRDYDCHSDLRCGQVHAQVQGGTRSRLDALPPVSCIADLPAHVTHSCCVGLFNAKRVSCIRAPPRDVPEHPLGVDRTRQESYLGGG